MVPSLVRVSERRKPPMTSASICWFASPLSGAIIAEDISFRVRSSRSPQEQKGVALLAFSGLIKSTTLYWQRIIGSWPKNGLGSRKRRLVSHHRRRRSRSVPSPLREFITRAFLLIFHPSAASAVAAAAAQGVQYGWPCPRGRNRNWG